VSRAIPLVVLVGRPNVGKSTLFNRITRTRKAIVTPVAGTTRDLIEQQTSWLDVDFRLLDTGGMFGATEDPLQQLVVENGHRAIAQADLLVLVLDGQQGLIPGDLNILSALRATNKPILAVVNKIDVKKAREAALQFYELGIDPLFEVSAEHGVGVDDLLDEIVRQTGRVARQEEPEATAAREALPKEIGVAIVGRPNAGKSSLVNRLVGEARQIVDDRPGTTVDSVDTLYEKDGERLVLIDTAGIRKKARVDASLESLAVLQAIRAMERSDVVVLLVDAETGSADQDAKIAGLAEDRGVGIVVALNKADLLDGKAQKRAESTVRDILAFVPWATVVLISAKTGHGMPKLLRAMRTAARSHVKRIGTAELNRFFEDVLGHHPPPTHKGKAVRLYYITQAGTRPPTFIAISNHPDAVHPSYRRYVSNAIRSHFGFEGTPLRVLFRPKKKESR
jgi:GTP-binding protein